MSTPREGRVTVEELAGPLGPIAFAFVSVLVLLIPVSYLYLVPDPRFGTVGIVTGLLLGAVSWVAPRWLGGMAVDGAARRGVAPEGEAAAVRSATMVALAFAELPGLLSLPLAVGRFVDAAVIAPAMLISAASVWFNALGTGAVQRYLDRLRG